MTELIRQEQLEEAEAVAHWALDNLGAFEWCATELISHEDLDAMARRYEERFSQNPDLDGRGLFLTGFQIAWIALVRREARAGNPLAADPGGGS